MYFSKFVFAMLFVTAMLYTACGGNKSNNPVENELEVSSCAESESSSSVNDVEKNSVSSSSVTLAKPCKTDSTDTCEYGSLTDARDGQIYKTVKIGDQWWMAENLNFKTDRSRCYNDSLGYCEIYGRLYSWIDAVDMNESECGDTGYLCSAPEVTQGVCPLGWHLPTKTEFETLVLAVGGSWNEWNGWSCHGSLVSIASWKKNIYSKKYDEFGFAALPAGHWKVAQHRKEWDRYEYEGEGTCFWSATDIYDFAAHCMTESGYLNNYDKGYATSVRCIKD